MPEISVILIVDDENEDLQETVNSVFMQSFTGFELLVVKERANSYGDTWDDMEFDDIRLRILNVVSFKEPGVWRQVMESIKGKYVVLMDVNHLMIPRKLHMQFSFMENHGDVDVCGTWVTENAMLRSDLRNKALERARLFNESAIMDQIYTVLG